MFATKTPAPALLLMLLSLGLPAFEGLGAETARVEVRFDERRGPMEMDRMSLGQGGLSDEPMWADRVPEIRALRPKLIRLFVQEYFDLLPAPDSYHFQSLDRSIQTIIAAGAQPLMCLCFKPKVLFPAIDQDTVEPVDYAAWEKLVFQLVRHCQEQNFRITYWEIGNEPDIGEDGGCPYRFKPESYVRYYEHTARAVLRADPDAKVGGPALASSASPLLPALLSYCETNHTPLHFVSWHIYSSDPHAIRGTVEFVRNLARQFTSLKLETILDEWNMDLMAPPLDPRFQPCFICETIWQMKAAGLDYSCYYHIRDWHVRRDQFLPFMSERGASFMARWWNRMPQFDGLFDYEDQVRPSYFAFKLLSRLGGDQLQLTCDSGRVRGFASHDPVFRCDNLLVWNFSQEPIDLELNLQGLVAEAKFRHIVLDALSPGTDENSRLRPDPFARVDSTPLTIKLRLDPYAVHYWYFE